MVHRITLCKLKDGVSDAQVERLMRDTRIHLLKLPEARSVRCGKRIPADQEWPFFIAMDFETRDKMRHALSNPVHVKFMETVFKPAVAQSQNLEFETDPLKDTRYS